LGIGLPNLLSPPDFFPAEINPNKTAISGFMMDYKLTGQYWVPIVYFIGLLFNIFGEEFLWRGIILPRQIEKYKSKAWIYHGIIWTFWHFFWTWNIIVTFPFAMALSYVAYKRQNTWIPILAHGLINTIPLVLIIIEVLK
jgi:membrane protease YdiL (CAAX protease family)